MFHWCCKTFNELSVDELYGILKLRIDVFIIEQQCIFQDADNKDQYSHHLFCTSNNTVVAYTRLIPAGKSYEEISIGRVATASQFRNEGLGKELMKRSIDSIWEIYGKQPIRIGAQLYLKRFYESFAFKQVSEIYLEDNIEHIEMILIP